MLGSNPIDIAVTGFLLATAITVLIVPLVRALGLRFGITDQPDPRKQHDVPKVRLGGIAICLGLLLTLVITGLVGRHDFADTSQFELVWIILSGSFCFFLIGLADDILTLSPFTRLALQVFVSIAAWSQGVRLDAIDLSLFGDGDTHIVLPKLISLLATVIWLAGLTNAINWLDGLDGLAAGVAGISAIGLAACCFSTYQSEIILLAAPLAGCCLGFLRYNFNPSRILMGDGGSYFIGFTLAAISLIGYSKNHLVIENGISASNVTAIISFQLPMLILLVPIVDMFAVIIARLREGLSPFFPDRRHLHHRLLRAGLNQRSTVLLIYAHTAWLSAIAYTLAGKTNSIIVLTISSCLLFSILLIFRRQLFRRVQS